MSIPLNALIVEDSADDAALLVRELQKNGFDLKWKRIEMETVKVPMVETRSGR